MTKSVRGEFELSTEKHGERVVVMVLRLPNLETYYDMEKTLSDTRDFIQEKLGVPISIDEL